MFSRPQLNNHTKMIVDMRFKHWRDALALRGVHPEGLEGMVGRSRIWTGALRPPEKDYRLLLGALILRSHGVITGSKLWVVQWRLSAWSGSSRSWGTTDQRRGLKRGSPPGG